MNYKTITRQLYLKQHSRISNDNNAFKRIFKIYEDQNYAKSKKLGLWKSKDPIQPWRWRGRDK